MKEKKYMQLLKEACVHFEPDDPEFIRVTNRVYEVVDSTQDYDLIWSTRFYGPLVYYLTWFKKLDNIISYYLNKMNIEDVRLIIKLYSLINPDCKVAKLMKEEIKIEEIIKVSRKFFF